MNKLDQVIQARFGSLLDPDEIATISRKFALLDPATQAEAHDMGLILSDVSLKAAIEYYRMVPETVQIISTEELPSWVGLGIRIAEKSSAAGIKFFKQGGAGLSQLSDPHKRYLFFRHGMTIANQDYNLALEYYQQAPTLLARLSLSDDDLTRWIDQALELRKKDYTLAIEYFRITPILLTSLSLLLLPKWVKVAIDLAHEKLFSALLFIRTSPETFSNIPSHFEKERLLDLMGEVIIQRPTDVPLIFSESVAILSAFRKIHQGQAFLDAAIKIALYDAEVATLFFLNSRKVLTALGPESNQFPEWADHGISLLKKDRVAARLFFLFESKSAHQAVDQLKGGVSLKTISRRLKLFSEALSGKEICIQATTAVSPKTPATIWLPPYFNQFSTEAENIEWYKIATAYQAGYLEFGTFTPTLEAIQKFSDETGGRRTETSFADLFLLFPDTKLIEQLFEIAEGARIEYFLRDEYPGLHGAMNRMREAELHKRPPLMGLSPRGVLVELLSQISIAAKTKEPIPPVLQATLFEACRMMGPVQDKGADVISSLRAAKRVYQLIQTEDKIEPIDKEMEPFQDRGEQRRGSGKGEGKIGSSVRGFIDPHLVKATSFGTTEQEPPHDVQQAPQTTEGKQETRFSSQDAEEMQTAEQVGRPKEGFFYDEWDCEAEDYRLGWCQVMEREVTSEGISEAALTEKSGWIQAIQTAFSYLRPEERKRFKGELDGEELDLDALIRRRADMKAGETPSDRVYIQRRKKERSVAALFLVDLSGSTQQQIASKSVLQIEKEALGLLAKAMEAVGDPFAFYGFSGNGRGQVDFYRIKEFDEPYILEIDRRIAALKPALQNRDGAAIRHAVYKLAAQPYKIKTLILISDGKPLDSDYARSYAIADTAMALREARQKGIYPYCITVDREGEEYLKGMYGEVAFTVMDDPSRLPERLPQIYKRLTS